MAELEKGPLSLRRGRGRGTTSWGRRAAAVELRDAAHPARVHARGYKQDGVSAHNRVLNIDAFASAAATPWGRHRVIEGK